MRAFRAGAAVAVAVAVAASVVVAVAVAAGAMVRKDMRKYLSEKGGREGSAARRSVPRRVPERCEPSGGRSIRRGAPRYVSHG
ncbi:hypothetical protein GCM10027091_69230 [Streptomyces daliensis]